MHRQLYRLLFLVFATAISISAQSKPYEGPNDPAGDIGNEREGYMTGNRVYLYFQNTTELSDWPRVDASLWPNTFEGTRTLDGIGLLVGARVYIENDTIPVDDLAEIQSRSDLDTLFFLQTSYRQKMDTDPTGTVEWGYYPVTGYFNENSEYPAMSNRSTSWPTIGWPSSGTAVKWPGEWNGRFGRGVIYADLETYFAVNDAHDQESLGFEDRIKYYPRSNLKFDNLATQAVGDSLPWGGLGTRVEQRGFQWNNPQARDAIFWEYSIANISDYDLPEVAFGYWVDTWIGYDNASDDLGFFDVSIDMAYSWDQDGIGFGGRRAGTLGFAYLESPGIADDMIDNDQDGLTDEKRDNEAVAIVGPMDGITNLTDFLNFYKLDEADLRDHWDADEDQDWDDGVDVNGDGIYQLGEDPGDDVGLDGVGPGELNYTGPDEGEGNHRPDYRQGVGSEPDFNATDVTETDMIGLTSFRLFNIPNHSACFQWFCGDQSMWDLIGNESLIEYIGATSNLIMTFASGPFTLEKGREERISMSELHSYDPLSGLNSASHGAPALFEQKRIVQVIYEKDYRFAQPPRMPTLSASAGDGEVILTWDDISDTRTRDPFVGNVNDFEGYKLFRATDKKFSDPQVITDGFGAPSSLKPIFQVDKIDTISGFAQFGHVNGLLYYLGNETGIVHHYVDTEVQNGRTYYYALVAYDYGVESLGISPSENNIVLELDENEDVRFTGINVQVVTPRQEASGYVAPSVSIGQNDILLGSGTVRPEVLSQKDIEVDHTYMIKFHVDTLDQAFRYELGMIYTTAGYTVYDLTDSNEVVFSEKFADQTGTNIVYADSIDAYYLNPVHEFSTDVFEGLRLTLDHPLITAEPEFEQWNWITGSAPINVTTTQTESLYFPWEFNIIFTGDPAEYTGQVTSTVSVRDEFGTARLSNLLSGQAFPFYVINKSFVNSDGQYEKYDLMAQDMDGDGQFNMLVDRVFVGPISSNGGWAGTAFIFDFVGVTDEDDLPQPDDIYQIDWKRPFHENDSLMFTVLPAEEMNIEELASQLDNVRVVPNPYIATNMMESSVANIYLNQGRRIMFTNVPAQCTIKIFTSSGILVEQLDVNNASDVGIAHWNLRSREGLEVAAGMYFYHLVATASGEQKVGKIAIIK